MNATSPHLPSTDLLHALRVDPAENRPTHRDDELRSRSVRGPRWPLVVLAAAAGMACSLFLLPRTTSIGATSADRQSVLARLEASVAAGDRSPDALIALARERQRAGNTNAGLALLQGLVGDQPRLAPAWQALADMLYDSGRTKDALASLERAQRLTPTAERERVIAAWRASSSPATLAPTTAPSAPSAPLATPAPTPSTAAATPPDVTARAESLLAAGSPQDAMAELDALALADPPAVDARVVALRMQIILARTADTQGASRTAVRGPAASASKPDAAVTEARTWLTRHSQAKPEDVLVLSNVLARAGHPSAAAKMLEPWLSRDHDDLTAAWVRAMAQSGQADAALARLHRLGSTRPVDDLLRQRVRSALESGKADNAIAAMRSHGIDRTPADVITLLVDAVIRDPKGMAPRAALLRDVWSRAGTRLEQHDTAAAARVAWAAGDVAAASRLADAALPGCEGKGDCAVRLAWLNHQLGRGPETTAALEWVRGAVDEHWLVDYARLAALHGSAGDALARLERQRQPVPSAEFDAAWALVASAAGRQADVVRWLSNARGEDIAPGVLRELFDAAIRAKAHALTVAVGERLDARTLEPSRRVMLAQATMEVGHTAEALAQWRSLRATTRAYDDAYARALQQALSRGVGAEARHEFAKAQLVAFDKLPIGDRGNRESVVRRLLDLGAHADALPALEALTLSDPDRWLSTYEDIAQRVGHADKLGATWRKVSTHPRLTREQRLHVADRLTSADGPRAADPALRILAADVGPDDPSARRLLASWGTSLTPDQIDWVEARVLRADGGDETNTLRRAAWLRVLSDRASPPRTISLVRRMQPRPTSGPVFEVYVDALRRVGDRATLTRVLGDSSLTNP